MATQQQIDFVKTNANGYIGGYKIARKATDEEINVLIDLNEQYGKLHNEAEGLKRLYYNLIEAIEGRP